MLNNYQLVIDRPTGFYAMLDLSHYQSTSLLDSLSCGMTDKLLSSSRITSYTDGQLIHTRGSSTRGLSVIASGAVHVGINGLNGVYVTTTLLGVGECFGEFTLFTDLPRTHDISARGQTKIHEISSLKFERLYNSEPELSRALLKVTLLRNHVLLEMLDALRRLPVLERTAKTVLMMSYSSGDDAQVLCRQEDLAYSLGVTRVSLGKALGQLKELELLYPAYGKVRIPDRQRLVEWVRSHCDMTAPQP